MRIISGQARGRKLATLEGDNTRPTLDRTREALFNILQMRVRGAKVLDLFAEPFNHRPGFTEGRWRRSAGRCSKNFLNRCDLRKI